MCRQELEIFKGKCILEILEKAQILQLALSDDYCPYVVPVNYGYEWQGENLFFYIHGAKQEKQMSLLTSDQQIGFELEYNHVLATTEQAEKHVYNRIVGHGWASILFDVKEKKHALLKLMEHETGKYLYEIPNSKIKNTEIIKIEVTSMMAKKRK